MFLSKFFLKKHEIKATKQSLYVLLDPENNKIEFAGRSFVSYEFWNPVYKKVESFLKIKKNEKIIVDFRIEYFNTATSRCFVTLFKILEKSAIENNNILVRWFYEEDDEDQLEIGENFASILKINFEIIEEFENWDIYMKKIKL